MNVQLSRFLLAWLFISTHPMAYAPHWRHLTHQSSLIVSLKHRPYSAIPICTAVALEEPPTFGVSQRFGPGCARHHHRLAHLDPHPLALGPPCCDTSKLDDITCPPPLTKIQHGRVACIHFRLTSSSPLQKPGTLTLKTRTLYQCKMGKREGCIL